jgi:hypothetical protein
VTRPRLLKIIVPLLAILAMSVTAFAYWTTAGAGSASGSVATLNAPTNVVATGGISLAHVSWTGSALSTGTPAQGYYVQRYGGSPSPAPACGTDPANSATHVAHTSGTITCTDSGVAPGTYTYKVTAVYHSWTAQSAASGSTTVVALDHFVVSGPASATAGSPFSVTVTAKDSSGNTVPTYTGTIHFTSSDTQAVLPANYTFTSGDAGSHSFSSGVTSKTAGSQSVSVSDTVQTAATGSATVTVSAASPAKLAFTQQPSNSTGGVAFVTQPKVAVQDAFGNVVTTDSSTVGLSITSGTPASGGPGTLSGCAQSESNGVVSFSGCKIDTSGTGYKLHATDGTLTAADSNGFDVSIGTASQIVLSGATTTLTAGSTRTLTATIEDAGGNTISTGADSSRNINFAQTAGSGSVSGTGSATASAGVATKTVTGNIAGTVSLQASATLSGPGATTSNTVSFTVTFGSASQIALTGSTVALASGTSRTLQATIKDAAGNIVTAGTDSGASVTFSQPSGTGSVTGLGSSTASGGVATKIVTGNIAGPVDLRASATLSGPGATSSSLVSFTVTFGTASRIVVSGSTGTLASGTTRVVTATITDAAGNTVTGGPDATDTLTFSKASGSGSVTGLGSSAAAGGVATDTVTGNGAGNVSIQAAGTLNGVPTTSANTLDFTVVPGTATKLAFTTQPTTTVVGASITPSVKVSVEDTNGNVVTTDNSTKVTLAIGTNPSTATLTGGGQVTVVNGVATYASASINKTGTGYTLTATDTTTPAGGHPYTPTTSSTFNVVSPPAIVSVSINNKSGGASGTPEAGDTIVFTYSAGLKMTSICSASTLGNTASGSITPNATSTTVQLAKSTGSTTPIAFSSTDCTLHLGGISLPVNYVGGSNGATLTFAGSTVAWNGSNTISVTLGGTVSGSSTAPNGSNQGTFTPDTAITDPSGNAISGTPFSWTAVHF